MAMITPTSGNCPDETTGLRANTGPSPLAPPLILVCATCMRRKDPATGRAYGPPVPRDLPHTSHGICRHCARLTWESWRASEPDKQIPTYATMRRHAARQRRLEELH